MRLPYFEWTQERTALLTSKWDEGLTCSQISTDFSTKFNISLSRNAIIGKVCRLNLPMRGRKFHTQKDRAPRKPSPRKDHLVFSPPIAAEPLPLIEDDRQIPISQRRQFLELDENYDCHWPVGDPGRQGFFFCGHPSADIHGRRPYCAFHMQRALSHPPRGGAVGDYASAGRKAFHLRQAAKGGFDARDRLDDVGDAA